MTVTDRGDSRTKIVAAARNVFYERGFKDTSFADLARASGVPKGNFYYHFPSKAELLTAVLDERRRDSQAMLSSWEHELGNPRQRLLRFVQMLTDEGDDLVHYGCPIGSLVTELGKAEPELHRDAQALLALYVDWVASQLVAAGHDAGSAQALALRVMSRCQGAIVVAQGYRDRRVLAREVEDIERWVASLGGDPPDQAISEDARAASSS